MESKHNSTPSNACLPTQSPKILTQAEACQSSQQVHNMQCELGEDSQQKLKAYKNNIQKRGALTGCHPSGTMLELILIQYYLCIYIYTQIRTLMNKAISVILFREIHWEPERL